MSDDILVVFDEVADQLRDILRLDLLPALDLSDEIARLVQSNLARLGEQRFEAIVLSGACETRGFVVEEDEELLRILQASDERNRSGCARRNARSLCRNQNPEVRLHFPVIICQ